MCGWARIFENEHGQSGAFGRKSDGVRHKRLSKLVGASNEEIVEILGLPPSALLGIKHCHRMHEIYQDFECSDEMSR